MFRFGITTDNSVKKKTVPDNQACPTEAGKLLQISEM